MLRRILSSSVIRSSPTVHLMKAGKMYEVLNSHQTSAILHTPKAKAPVPAALHCGSSTGMRDSCGSVGPTAALGQTVNPMGAVHQRLSSSQGVQGPFPAVTNSNHHQRDPIFHLSNIVTQLHCTPPSRSERPLDVCEYKADILAPQKNSRETFLSMNHD